MLIVVPDSRSQVNSSIFSQHTNPTEEAGTSPNHDHGYDIDDSKFCKGGDYGHAYSYQPQVIDENLPDMNPSIMPKVEAEVNLQSPASSSEKVGGWRRMWIIELISLFLIIVLRGCSTGSLLKQVGYGEREGCGAIVTTLQLDVHALPTALVSTDHSFKVCPLAAEVNLSASSADLLLVQVGYGEREGCGAIVTTLQLDVHALPTALVSTDHSFKVGSLSAEVIISASSADSLLVQVGYGEREGCGGGGGVWGQVVHKIY
jgi:hypothetical protein